MTVVQNIARGDLIRRKRNAILVSSKKLADRIDMNHELYLKKENGLEPFTDSEWSILNKALV